MFIAGSVIQNLKEGDDMKEKGKRMLAMAITLCSVVAFLPVQAEAKKIASGSAAKKLARSKVKGAVVTEVDTDYENGTIVYDVELHKGNREYSLEYRASDGKLMKYKWELIYEGSSQASKTVKKEAIRKAASKKVKKAKIVSVTLDDDLYKPEYDVVMKKGNKKYELSFNAHSAKLVEYEWKLVSGKSSKSKYIGLTKAKSIASKKVPGGRFVKVEFDKDDGVAVYEVEIKKGGMEYEMKIHAKTGKILEYESDIDD